MEAMTIEIENNTRGTVKDVEVFYNHYPAEYEDGYLFNRESIEVLAVEINGVDIVDKLSDEYIEYYIIETLTKELTL